MMGDSELALVREMKEELRIDIKIIRMRSIARFTLESIDLLLCIP